MSRGKNPQVYGPAENSGSFWPYADWQAQTISALWPDGTGGTWTSTTRTYVQWVHVPGPIKINTAQFYKTNVSNRTCFQLRLYDGLTGALLSDSGDQHVAFNPAGLCSIPLGATVKTSDGMMVGWSATGGTTGPQPMDYQGNNTAATNRPWLPRPATFWQPGTVDTWDVMTEAGGTTYGFTPWIGFKYV